MSAIEAAQARRRINELANESKAIVATKSLSNLEKLEKLNAMTAELKQHQDTLGIHGEAQRLMVGGESLKSGYATAAAHGRAMKGLATPNLALSYEMQQGLYQAAKSGQNLTIELKDAASSDATRTELPAQFGGLVDRRFEPTRILEHIPSTPMTGPSIEFIVHTHNTPGIGAPVLTLGTAASGGALMGTIYWVLTALNSGGETLASNEVTATMTGGQKQRLDWAAVTGATGGYRLYRGDEAGHENTLVAAIPAGTTTYTDTGNPGAHANVPTVDRSAGAAMVHAGGAYPETSLETVPSILVARKVGIFTTVVDELLSDFPTFAQYTEVELQRQITEAENWQLLNGDGTGDNVLGLLNVTGTLSRARGLEPVLDTIEQGITDLRNGPSYCEPDALIINPNTWSMIRRTKNTLGDYVLGDPGQSTVNDVWGVPVLQTTQIVPGTAVLGNLEIAVQALIREGITLQMTNSSDDDFTHGRVKIRANERLTLGVSRPTALNVLTL